jgi:hypothetical protein
MGVWVFKSLIFENLLEAAVEAAFESNCGSGF